VTLHRVDWHLEHHCDVGDIQIFLVMQQYYRARIRLQLEQQAVQMGGGHGVATWFRRQMFGPAFQCFQWQNPPLPCCLPQTIDGAMRYRSQQPVFQMSRAGDLGHRAMELQEGILSEFLGISMMPGDAQCQAVHPVLMDKHQPAEGRSITRAGALQIRRLVRRWTGTYGGRGELHLHDPNTLVTPATGAAPIAKSRVIIGTDVLAQLRLYIASKEQKIYFTRAASAGLAEAAAAGAAIAGLAADGQASAAR